MSPSFRRFAANILATFIAGAIAILLLELAEQNGLISNLTESIARFAVWFVLVALLLYSSRGLSLAARTTFRFIMSFLLLDFALDIIEDIPSLDNFPIVGGESPIRPVIEKLAVSCWGCGTIFLMYILMRDLDASFSELQKQNDKNVKLNQQLQCSFADLQEAQEKIIQQERLAALGQMANGVAHDLNNALTPVLAFSELLQEDPQCSEENLDALESIYAGASHAGQVVEQLQHFYRGNSADRDDRKIHLVRVRDIVEQAKEICRFRWLDEANKRGVQYEIVLDIHDNVTVVLGNRTELVQLLTNLLLNAVEAMEEGGKITVSVSQQDGLVGLVVSDLGVGMTPDEQKRCFEPFFSRKFSGTGLGLSVCHGIVRRHGGSIRCDENAWGGCDFTVLLPVPVEDEGKLTSRSGEAVNGNGVRVLVIDDDDLVRKSLAGLLNFMGNSVDTASDGASGIELARLNDYDLVITDLGMPGLTGREVVSEIKALRPNQTIAVASGWSPTAVSEEFEDQIQPDYYITKPINSKSLKKVLDTVLV